MEIKSGMKLEAFTEDSFSGWWAIRDSVTKLEVGSCDGGFYKEDARLFAAAPELLEALKEAVAEYEKIPCSLGYEFTHLPAMRAAIAKAEGK